MTMLDRPFVGLWCGEDLREKTREELYDILIEALERERESMARNLHESRILYQIKGACA